MATTPIVVFSLPGASGPGSRSRAWGPYQAQAVGAPYAGDQGSRGRVDDVAHGIDRHQRGDLQAVGELDQRGSHAAFHGASRTAQLADRGAGSRADIAFRNDVVPGGAGRPVAAVGVGTHGGVADAEVVQDRRRHDRHARRPRPVPDAPFVQVTHHSVGGGQAERAAAREDDCVHLLDGVDRVEESRLARARGRAAHVDRGGGAAAGEDNRTAGRPRVERVMSDLDAGDGRQPVRRRHGASRSDGRPGGRRRGAGDDNAGARC